MSKKETFIKRIQRRNLKESSANLRRAVDFLVQLAPEESHFVLELLQNAEDERANHLEFHLHKDRIVFINNGRVFQGQDVTGICSVGWTKKDPSVYIGFMGVGFKAVFQVTDAPEIYSGGFQFKFDKALHGYDENIAWQLVPHWIDQHPLPDKRRLTIIILPLKTDFTRQNIQNLYRTFYQALDPRILLFLKHIRTVTLRDEVSNCVIRIGKKRLRDATVVYKRKWLGDRLHEEEKSRWRIYESDFVVPTDIQRDRHTVTHRRDKIRLRRISLAFESDTRGNLLCHDFSTVFSFLPTDERTELKFLVQADFILTPSRTELRRNIPWNQWLIGNVHEVLRTAINQFKEHPIQKYQFYKVLPLEDEIINPEFKNHFDPRFVEVCTHDRLVATASNGWVDASHAVFADEAIIHLLATRELSRLQSSRGLDYVSPRIEGERERRFLEERLSIASIDVTDLIQFMKTEDWLAAKSQSWFAQLYLFLSDTLSLFPSWQASQIEQEIGKLHIAKLGDGTLEVPAKSLLPFRRLRDRVGIPPIPNLSFIASRSLRTGRRADNQKIRAFLRKLGVGEPDTRGIIEKAIIPLFEGNGWESLPAEILLHCLIFVKEYLESSKAEARKALYDKLGCLRLFTSNDSLIRADQVYLPASYGTSYDLELLFVKVREVSFTSDRYLNPDHMIELRQRRLETLLIDASKKEAKDIRKKIAELHNLRIKVKTDPEQWKRNWREFFLNIGVMDKPRVIVEKIKDFSWNVPDKLDSQVWQQYWDKHREHSTWYKRVSPFCYIDHFEELVADGNVKRLKLLFLTIAQNWSDYYSKYSDCEYHWYYYYQKAKTISSYLTFQLRSFSWISTTDGLRLPDQTYIRTRNIFTIAGKMLPYLTVDVKTLKENWRQFIEALGVNTRLEPIDTLRILGRLPEYSITKNTHDILRRIYRDLRAAIEDNPEIAETEHWNDVRSKLRLLGEDDNYYKATELYIREDETLYRIFLADVSFAWLPPEELPSNFYALMEKLGLQRLSKDKVTIKISFGLEQESNVARSLASKILERRPFLRSIAAKSGVSVNKLNILSSLQVKVVDEIKIEYKLKHSESLKKEQDCIAFYDLGAGILTIKKGHEQDWIHVAKAMADGLGIEAYFDAITLVLQGDAKLAEEFLRMKNIPVLAEYVASEEEEEEEEEEDEEEEEEEEEEEGEGEEEQEGEGEEEEQEGEGEEEEEVTLEQLKGMETSMQGETGMTPVTKRPDEVVEMQNKIKRLYQKCQICGFPVFEGINKSKVYGHLRGHHLIPWQKKITVVDEMICLCQPHHHMIHHAKEVLLKVSRSNKIIDVIVNTQYIGKINTIDGHDVADYILENRNEIERNSKNIKIELME